MKPNAGHRTYADIHQCSWAFQPTLVLALGYNERETTETMRRLPADLPVSDAIRQALKLLGKA